MSALQRTASIMSISHDSTKETTIKNMIGLPIAPNLDEYFTQNMPFDPEALKSGDLSQLSNWVKAKNSSIYIKWIPDEFTEADANDIFSLYGPVSRIEFVPKMKDGKKIGRMMFVHFDQFDNANHNFARQVAEMHPNPVAVDYFAKNKYGVMKKYDLMCCINMRPIPKVEYTVSQLSDMFERLNSRTSAALTNMQEEINDLRLENQFLHREIQGLRSMSQMQHEDDISQDIEPREVL